MDRKTKQPLFNGESRRASGSATHGCCHE